MAVKFWLLGRNESAVKGWKVCWMEYVSAKIIILPRLSFIIVGNQNRNEITAQPYHKDAFSCRLTLCLCSHVSSRMCAPWEGVVWNACLIPGSDGSRTAQTRSWDMLPRVSKSFYFCLRHLRASFIVKLNSKYDGFAPHLACFNLSEVFFRSSGRISRRVELCFLCSGELLWETVGGAGGKSSLVGTVTHSMHTSTVTALNLVMCWICAPALGKLLWSFLRGQFVFYCIISRLYNLTIQSSVCHKKRGGSQLR